jgi:hypothetical protein
MSEKLELYSNARFMEKLDRDLKIFDEIATKDKYHMMIYTHGYDPMQLSFEFIMKPYKDQLIMICSALRINYDDLTFDKYEPGRSTFIGAGSWGMIGLAAALSIGSAINSSLKKADAEFIRMLIAYNEIAAIFNERFFPSEYAEWVEEMSVEESYISQLN